MFCARRRAFAFGSRRPKNVRHVTMVPSCHGGARQVSLSSRREKPGDGGAGGGSRTLTSLCRPYGFSCHFGFRRRHRRSWPGLSLRPAAVARSLAAARLVSTPSRRVLSVRAWLGIAISGFPDFGQFCVAGFPGEHSVQSVASASSATPVAVIAAVVLDNRDGAPQIVGVPARLCVLARFRFPRFWPHPVEIAAVFSRVLMCAA